VRVIRGRAPRQALAAKKANAERQKSGSKAGPSGRVTADYSFLSADQQQVRCASHLASSHVASGMFITSGCMLAVVFSLLADTCAATSTEMWV